MIRINSFILSLVIVVGAPACQKPASDDPPVTSSSRSLPDSETRAERVEYEPAYPADVSSEALSDRDIAQQETAHSHDGGEEHPHHDDHEHGEEDDHDGHQH